MKTSSVKRTIALIMAFVLGMLALPLEAGSGEDDALIAAALESDTMSAGNDGDLSEPYVIYSDFFSLDGVTLLPAKEPLPLVYAGKDYTVRLYPDAPVPEDARVTADEISAELYSDSVADQLGIEKSDIAFLRVFDISLMSGDAIIEPDGPVRVEIDMATAGDKIAALHFTNPPPRTEMTGRRTLMQASPRQIETLETNVTEGTVQFTAGSFSAFAIVGYTLEKRVLASDGNMYLITVTYGADAGIPENAALAVEEILAASDMYDLYISKAEAALGMAAGTASYIRLFDISIIDPDAPDVKYQPAEGAAVEVSIELADSASEALNVVHFADEADAGKTISAETEGQTVRFQADGFSVYGVVSSGATADLNGKTFAIINTYTNNAIQAKPLSGGSNKLAAEAVTFDDMYVHANNDITLWTFLSAGNGKYYIQADTGEYLNINLSNNSGVAVSATPQALNVTEGANGRDGRIRITNDNGIAINNYSGSTASGFGTYSDSGNNEWFTLYDLIFLNPAYTASKISVQDLEENQQVILYQSVYNEASGAYEDYVIDGNGNLVKTYDKGDQITGRSAVSPVWTVIMHRDATTNELNGYYDFYNQETGMYLSPQGNGTLVSATRPGVTLNGRRDGGYNSTVEAWDSSSWAWYGYQVVQDENGDVSLASGTGAQSQAFSFAAYSSGTTGNTLHTVSTVDSAAAGITIKMYDFASRQQITDVVGGNNYQEGNHYNNSGIASDRLVDGFPTFTTGQSASALFDDSSSNYKGTANHLFLESVYNATGYYEYSSFNNFAYYNNGNFTVYQEIGTPNNDDKYYYKRGNFYPYNDLDANRPATNTNLYDGGGNALNLDDPTNNGKLYLVNGKNDYFGMTMEFTFMQPKNGYNNGGPMIYEFNGDDDLWIYIDGVKVLDIGGVHDALPGTINFATGEITYGSNMNNSEIPRTIKACFKKAGVFPDGTPWDESKVNLYFKGDTFVDYGSHSFKMFYMEHGAGASNLEMRFNLPVIEKGRFTVEKVLDGTTQQKFANVYFAYQAFKKDGTYDVPLTNAVYEGTNDAVLFYPSVIINGKTYANVFYLKPGEAATFPEMSDEEEYYVQELGVGSDYYDEIIVNDVKIDGIDATAVDGIYPTTVAAVGNRARVTYSNHCSDKNLNELRITKRLAEGETDDGSTFEFRVQLENAQGELAPYATSSYFIQNEAGEYFYYVDGQLTSNGFTPIAASVSGNNGTIAGIPAGYTVVIKDLLAETDFHVEEIRVMQANGTNATIADSYWSLDSKTVVPSSCDASTLSGTDWSGQPIIADGQIKLDTDAEEIFVNKSKPFDASATIKGNKIMEGRDQKANEFSFELRVINLDGTEKADGVHLTAFNSAGAAEQQTAFWFDAISYSMSQFYDNIQRDGSAYFYYVVKETIPEGAIGGVKDGVSYDQSQRLVIVRLWLDNGEPKSEWKAYLYDGSGVPSELQPVQTQEVATGTQA